MIDRLEPNGSKPDQIKHYEPDIKKGLSGSSAPPKPKQTEIKPPKEKK